MNEDTRYDVTLTDGTLVERYSRLDYVARNRLVDFAFRHDLRICVHESSPEPQRKTYR